MSTIAIHRLVFPEDKALRALQGFLAEHRHDRLDDLIHGATQDSVILLGDGEPDEVLAALRRLRRDYRLGANLMFCSRAVEGECEILSDGEWPDSKSLKKRVEEHNALLELLQEECQDPEDLLLRWSFLRPEANLRPLAMPFRSSLYTYPLLETLRPEGVASFEWRNSLVSRNLLKEESLVDRIRLCPSCSGGHLVFQERCPNCSSIDLHREEFIHCFPCGQVGPQSEFQDPEGLRCPKCRTVLRHIGADYDRPMENQRCRACTHVFSTPQVMARCLDCGTSTPPAQLHVESITELAITDAGRLAVRTGSLHAIYAVFDRERYATPQHFEQSLTWLCLLWARYKASPFSLLQLRVTNASELSLRIGRSSMILLLEEFARRLRTVIRDTDVTARLQEERITLLMPFTNADQARLAVQRLGDVSGKFQATGEDRLQVAWGLLSIPEHATGKEGQAALLARLAGMQQGIL